MYAQQKEQLPLSARMNECAELVKRIHKECEGNGRYRSFVASGRDHGLINPTMLDMEVAQKWLPLVTAMFHECNDIYATRHGATAEELKFIVIRLEFCLMRTVAELKELNALPVPKRGRILAEELSLAPKNCFWA